MCINYGILKNFLKMVRAKGLEPSHLSVYAPQTYQSTKKTLIKS